MTTILVVDDDPTIRAIATELLEKDGHRVLSAGDGREALSVLTDTPVDLVVLDMLMPNKDGLETILELRKVGPGPKILAISSGGRGKPTELLRAALAFGANAVLTKPLGLSTFADSVRDLLQTEESLELT